MNIPENKQKSTLLEKTLKHFHNRSELSVALIDLDKPGPEIFGYNMDKFIYPASMYKVFIGAEVLRQIGIGALSLDDKIMVLQPNDVDTNIEIFHGDKRPLLKSGERYSIDYLLNLMLSRSDNTASNCLIDLVSRECINKHIISAYKWNGSEVTRKYLSRDKDLSNYKDAPVTMSCAKHFAELFYHIEKGTLINLWVSERLKHYMRQQYNYGIPKPKPETEYLNLYSKGGWLETNMYKQSLVSAIKNILKKRWAIIRWDNDASVVTLPSGRSYILVFFSITKTVLPWKYFPVRSLKEEIMHFFSE